MQSSITGGINELKNKGCVKSRQVGYQSYGYSQLQASTVSIPISTVNPERCLLIVRDAASADGPTGRSFVYYTLSASAIEIHKTMFGDQLTELHVDWELIEFY